MSVLLIVGAGGHGKVVADIAEAIGKYSEIYFLDDNAIIGQEGPLGHPVVGGVSFANEVSDADIVVAIGNPSIRRAIVTQLAESEKRLVTLIHPTAIVSKHASVGEASVIMSGAVVGPDARLGAGVIVNTSASIDHDCLIGDYAHVSVGARLAGTVTIGEETWIGVGASVRNNVTICSGCTIGAGAVVVGDITSPGIYVGIPAEELMRKEA